MLNPQIDHETRVDAQDHVALNLWRSLLTNANIIKSRIRRELLIPCESTRRRFDRLAQLERSSDGLPICKLSVRMILTGGNVTTLTDQLEPEGLIEREADPADPRVTGYG